MQPPFQIIFGGMPQNDFTGEIHMKRILSFIIIAALCAVMLAGCGGAKSDTLDLQAAKTAALAVQATYEDGSVAGAFGELTEETPETLLNYYNIDVAGMKEYVILTPVKNVNACLLILAVPEERQKDTVKNNISRALTDYEQRWQLYLPAQYDLVANRTETEIGDCLIYIISLDNAAVLSAIRGTL